MTKLFVSDIDGCLAMPYEPYDLDRFQEMAAHAAAAPKAGIADRRPAVSLCSGRSYAYVEAMAQALGLTTPVLFESGGGMFDPVAAQTVWHPDFTPEVEAQIQEIRRWMQKTLCGSDTQTFVDHNKRTQAGVASPDTAEIKAHLPTVQAFVESVNPDFHVFTTHISIDVLPATITKKQGLEWLGRHLGIPVKEMAYIGDTGGDLPALKAVGASFAPANAEEAVRQGVDIVTDSPVLAGTLEAYAWCMQHNEATLAGSAA
jgi:hypothetical protein